MTGDRDLARRALPVAVLWVGFALCVHDAWVPFGHRFGVILSDDAYYVFGVAWHLAHGDPPSIDGVHPTNGFHPLWTALLVPIWALFRHGRDLETPISIALTLGAIFHLAGGTLLWRVMRRLEIGYGAALVALAYFSGNAYQIANAIGGLESALATAALLLAFLAFIRARAAPGDRRAPWLFGLACGAAILARTDQAITVGVLACALPLADRAAPRPPVARRLAVVAGVCAAVLLPWIAYSRITAGAVAQSSGLALALVHGRMPEAWGQAGGAALRLEQAWACVAESYLLLSRALLLGPYGLPALIAAAAVCASPEQRRRLAPLVAALLLLFAVHTCVRLSFREWYTGPFVAAAALLVGLSVDRIARRAGAGLVPVLAMAALVWPLYRGYVGWRTTGIWGPPTDMPAPAGPAPQDRFAYSDCGVIAYYATYGVTNLDGLTNQGAYEALRDRDLLAYVRKERFRSFGVSPSLESAAFLGRGYREAVVSLDERTFRVAASPGEKDARIGPRPEPYALADLAGRELLGDGWIWPAGGDAGVRSVGRSSEIVFYLPAAPTAGELALEVRAVVVGAGGTQPTRALLNGLPVAVAQVRPEPTRIAIPLGAARAGRNRLRLEYGAPRAVRADSPDWYRSLIGEPVLAIEASTLTFGM